MRTGLFTGHFANGRYAISVIAPYHIAIKKCFCSAWIAERPSGKFQGKNQSQIFDQILSMVLQWAKPKNHRAKIFHKKYRWFYGERHRKTTATQKKYRWFYRYQNRWTTQKIRSVIFRWLQLTTHIGGFIGCYRFTNGERTHRWFFYSYLRWFSLLGSPWHILYQEFQNLHMKHRTQMTAILNPKPRELASLNLMSFLQFSTTRVLIALKTE